MELNQLRVSEFAQVTASDAPAPGGGRLCPGRGLGGGSGGNGGPPHRRAGEICRRPGGDAAPFGGASALRGKLLEAVDRDSRAFDRYMEALAMPKATPEEQTARKAAMQEGLKAAAQVPMEVAETVASLFPALETAVRKGNPNAVTDGMVGDHVGPDGGAGCAVQCSG